MRAVLPYATSSPSPRLGELPDPTLAADEVLIDVRATALNRADLLQMRGLYQPPQGESEIPGLECAGVVTALGAQAQSSWQEGDRVMALLGGGGHAERVAVPATQLMPIPDGWSFEDAAAIPEALLTAWTNLVAEGGLSPTPTDTPRHVLITAATSGVGIVAVQLAKALGARVLVAGRSRNRLERLMPYGADITVPLDDDLPTVVREVTDNRGVELVMDMAGGMWTAQALEALAPQGRLVLVGLMAGLRAEIDLSAILRRRLKLLGSVLRTRSRAEKTKLVTDVRHHALPLLESGKIQPVIDQSYEFEQIPDAYHDMAEGGHWGKLVVRVP
ncbi:MAG: NAD(P)H-quinone oxidoreductase [Acidobacteriota bacterium]